MRQAGVREARQNLSALLEHVREGREVLITDHGRPVARLLAPLPLSLRPFSGRRALRRQLPSFEPGLSTTLAGSAPAREVLPRAAPASGPLYLDSTALARLYLSEPGSDALERALRGRRDLTVSELAATELITAFVLRSQGVRSGPALPRLQSALIEDLDTGMFRRAEMSPRTHRTAERLAIALGGQAPVRSTVILHVALAVSADATVVVTFDPQLADACTRIGMATFP